MTIFTGAARPEWSGDLVFEPGLLAFTGRIGTAATHSHACVQIVDVAAGAVQLSDRHGDTRTVRTALIPAGVSHTITAEPSAHGRIVYLDPASLAGRAATRRIAESGDPQRAATWTGLTDSFPALVRGFAGRDNAPLHPALRRALQLGNQSADLPDLSALADRVGLSASRLGHLFRAELGLPYPTWRRWTRLLRALEHTQAGATLTESAHAAGFADSAHLTRTCRALFGITPTEALQATGGSQ